MKHTHHHLATVLTAFAMLCMSSCRRPSTQNAPPPPKATSHVQEKDRSAATTSAELVIAERLKAEHTAQLKAEHAAQLKAEHDLRLSAEQQCVKEQATSMFWQNLTLWLGAGATLLLLVGTALGSSARHETEKP